MSNYYIARSEDRLYFEHHGILGQKWGKKNGPPYPLDAKSHSASEKKAGTKGWTSEAKNMSTDELRKAVNRKNLENQYHQYASNTGKNKRINDVANTAGKTFRTTGKVARTVSTANRYAAYDKVEAIDDDENLSKKQKKIAKRQLKEVKNQNVADLVGNTSNIVANSVPRTISRDKTDLSSMTDKELREAIDRMALETQYDRLYGVKTGKDRVDDILDAAGNIAEVAGTAITIALLIKGIRKP